MSAVTLTAQVGPSSLFHDDFSTGRLDIYKWKIATGPSPNSKLGVNEGIYTSKAVDFSQGMLRISSSQKRKKHRDEVTSYGGAIISLDRFGYGTYKFVMRMSSTSSTPNGTGAAKTGSVSSGYLYFNKSETEIDLEFLGDKNVLWVTNWHNEKPKKEPKPQFDDFKQETQIEKYRLSTDFYEYRIEWTPGSVKTYIDDALVAEHTEHVPSAPAYIMLQHHGTNSDAWGGFASDEERYFFVKSVSFTPMR